MKKLYLALLCVLLAVGYVYPQSKNTKKKKSAVTYNKQNKENEIFLEKQFWLGAKGGINFARPTLQKSYPLLSPTNYNLSEMGEQQFIAGLYYRHKDAVIPMLGFETNDLKFTFSYDATISTLNNFNGYRGASEFTLVKKGFYPTSAGRQSLCPSF